VVLDPANRDDVVWSLEKSKNFTTKSLYRFTTHKGVGVANAKTIWKTKLFLKTKVFLWQLLNNKLQMGTKLKGGPRRVVLSVCGKEEDTSHIFF
jgi:hypothetical protein